MTPAGPDEEALAEVIEALAPLERRAGSDGEREAAEWIAARLTAAGSPAQVEPAEYREGYPGLLGALSGAGAVAGVTALVTRRAPARRLAAAVAATVTAALADDASNGTRLARRAAGPAKPTWNVVGSCGDPGASRTLVVLAHHDAALSGRIFDDRALRWVGDRFPGLLERKDTSLPLWWVVVGGPLLVALGAGRDRRGVLATGTAASVLSLAALQDIAHSPVVPGANDNLTAVAVLVALAERLAAQPADGVRVLLASCGAEEVVQGGIYSFAERHFPSLDRRHTWFLNLDTVGSPRLVLVEGEGVLVMEDYHDRSFRDLVERTAAQVGAPVLRGLRARTSTDAVVPSRAGYPTATLVSVDRYKALSNYHQMSDTPENVDYRTVRQALTVTEAVARELAANPWIGGA